MGYMQSSRLDNVYGEKDRSATCGARSQSAPPIRADITANPTTALTPPAAMSLRAALVLPVEAAAARVAEEPELEDAEEEVAAEEEAAEEEEEEESVAAADEVEDAEADLDAEREEREELRGQ